MESARGLGFVDEGEIPPDALLWYCCQLKPICEQIDHPVHFCTTLCDSHSCFLEPGGVLPDGIRGLRTYLLAT